MTENVEPFPQDEALAQQLLSEAFALLDRHDVEGAARLAERLAQMRHSGTFEVQSEVHRARGEHTRAREVLEEGVRAAPGVWLLWQSLGNALTIEGRYDEALSAYARALDCPAVDAPTVHFNRGMALARHGRFEEAWAAFEQVTSSLLRFQAATFRLALGNDLNRFDRVVEEATALLAEEGQAQEDRARVHAQLGRAYLQGYDDQANARLHADRALRIWPQEPTARGVIRALDSLKGGAAPEG